MDLDEAMNMTSNSTEEVYHYTADFYERLFLELFTLVGLLSVAANALILFVIFKFKKLQVTNIIIAHICVLEAVYLLVTPLSLRVIILFVRDYDVHMVMVCVLYENECVLTVAICLFLFLLVSDWYLKTYNEARYAKFCRVYRFFIAGIYICALFLCTLSTMLCFKGLMLVATMLCMFVCYAVLFVFLIVMNVVHSIRKRRLRTNKHNVGLFMANIFFVFWIPIIVLILLALVARIRPPPEVTITAFILGFTSPVWNLLYLFYKVDVFNVLLWKVFRCQCNKELLEDQSVSYSEAIGVNIDKN